MIPKAITDALEKPPPENKESNDSKALELPFALAADKAS
jgi:hypothetical protein